jgi:Spy/CpxP family protein refolding chaperone
MNRRQMVILPGVALAAGRGFSQTQQSVVNSSTGSGSLSRKAAAHFTRLKSFSTIPKSDAKQAKYIHFLTSLLSLTSNQQTQTATIFSAARASIAALKPSMKTARQNLGEAVIFNAADINQASAVIGNLAAQRHSIGASANAAFYQILTSAQQATLNQLRS